MMSKRFTKASLLTGSIMAGAMFASPVFAQAQVDEDPNEPGFQAVPDANDGDNDIGEPIVVTGSRIARRNIETAAPIAVVNDEEFQLSGTVNVENVINTLPQVVPGTTSFSNNPGNGTATLNLRGLGEPRTLVLVNGRRWVSFDTTQVVDLNTIPSFLLDGVDVVTGGASAVYGSDALAGVVNFRLRQVEGAELGGQYALTERGDGESYNIHGALGASFDDGRGSATVFAEYFNRASVFQGDRAFSNFALGGESIQSGFPLQQFGSSTPPQGRINTPGSVAIAVPQDLNGDGDTNDPGEAPTAPLASGLTIDDLFFTGPGVGRRRTGADTYNYAPANYLQIPQERYLLGGYADYEFADGHEAYTEVVYVNNRVATELAATPVTGTFNVDLDTIRPFVSDALFAEFQLLDQREAEASALRVANGLSALPTAELGVVSTFIQRRVVETGSRNSLDERNAFRVLGGVRGDVTDYIRYDAYYSYARTRNANVQAGNISRSAFQAGLDGSGTPINIFGPGTLTDDQVTAITIQAQNGDISTLEVASGALSGTFGNFGLFGADPIGFAVGAEYRRVASEFIPDTALSSGDVIGFNAGLPTEGSYNVRELFGELNIPVFETDGGTRLDLDGAVRYSDYSLDAVGGVFTYAGGAKFAIVPDVILRAQYQRAIRAPNVGELFGGQSIGFPGATDPCASDAFATDSGLAAVCNASLPAGAVVVGPFDQPNTQIPATFGGNPALTEETSDSYTFGVVLQPRFIPGFTLTADYYNIEIEDAIATFGGGLNNALDLCFNQVQNINDPICAPFRGTRDPSTGAITVDNTPLVLNDNIASLEVSGIDLEASYSSTLPFSLMTDTGEQDFNISFLGSWTEKNNFTPVQGFDTVITCAGEFGTTCGEPTPEFKWTSRFSFIDGPLTTSIRWRYIDSVRDDNPDIDYAAFNGTEVLDDVHYFDLTFAFEATERFTVNFGVNNIFDKLPATPQFNEDLEVSNNVSGSLLGDNQQQANTYTSTYDVLGRRYFVSAAFKF